jgi:hypothetical protein
MPKPDVNLEVGSGSHAWQTAEVMKRFEPVVLERKPDVVLVYGDVNSTVAAALTCSKLLIRVGHVEAGPRSFDRTMLEEINRMRDAPACRPVVYALGGWRYQSSARGRSAAENLPSWKRDDRFSYPASSGCYATFSERPAGTLCPCHATSSLQCRQ